MYMSRWYTLGSNKPILVGTLYWPVADHDYDRADTIYWCVLASLQNQLVIWLLAAPSWKPADKNCDMSCVCQPI